MKNEKGITLMSLVITIVMMSILAVIGVNYGTSTIKAMQYQNFNYQLEQIQGRVDVIHEKINSGDNSYQTMGESATLSSNANSVLTSLGLKSSDYRYFTPQDLEKYLNISNVEQEVAINFQTKDVVSINGFLYEGKMHYRLND